MVDPGFISPDRGSIDLKTLNIIGCGKVGQTLGHLLHASKACKIQDLKASSASNAAAAAGFIGDGRAVDTLAEMRAADIWLISVPDALIGAVAADLAADLRGRSQASDGAPMAFHCSGLLPASVLDPLRQHGFALASAHPVLTFADPTQAVRQFPGSPCGIEGDAAALAILHTMLEAIGGSCFLVQTALKPLYHAAAVFCNNFTVVLQAIAHEAWIAADVPAELVPKIQALLLQATAENVIRLGPRAITGPAARGDHEVVRLQGAEVLRWHPEAGVLYQELSRLARRLALRESTREADLEDPR